MTERISYKATLNLPRTDFPMKGNMPIREKDFLQKWENEDLYGQIRKQSNGRKHFHLHDGPPFANGDIHLGHALNKILKDIVVRYKTMRGFDAPFVPGWDCHGLPIEHQVAKELGSAASDPVKLRLRSEETARKFIDIQREQFKRLGVSGDWPHPYLTLDREYEAEILRLFADLVEKGWVYQGLRPVYWSTGCRTALAEAEVEYKDRTDTSIFVKFAIDPDEIRSQAIKDVAAHENPRSIYVVVWTTTPWTLPANLAVAAHPDLQYQFFKNEEAGEVYLIADSRVWDLERVLKRSLKRCDVKPFAGRVFENEKWVYRHPFLDRKGRIYTADFVTADSGSGLVHIAPGHGHDDYVLGNKFHLEPLSPVDDRGCLTKDCGVDEVIGMYVFKANSVIVDLLNKKERLLSEEPVTHSYPHCWRSQTPIVFRSVKQWFIRVEAFRSEALHAIDAVQWIPDWGKNRIRSHVELRHDWCISRQRAWGVPIPVFFDEKMNPLLDAKVIRRFADIVESEGTHVWYLTPDADLAARCGISPGLSKGKDTLDVWIDSGSSFRAVGKKRLDFPADLYLEGSDQHRGWFQSSLLLSCATEKKSPYRSVLTHGFVVDGEGRKMSKSQGNVVSPQEVIQKLGADILRLWVVSSGYTEDIRVSTDIFARVSDSYRKFRNTFKYLLGNLEEFDPGKDALKSRELLEVDRWALSKLAELVEEATRAYDQYQYYRFYQLIYNFCVREMSSFYFDILKDRLYADAKDSISGRSCRTALYEIFKTITTLLAPVLVFTCEEAWGSFKRHSGPEKSVHLQAWPANLEKRDPKLEIRWERLIGIRERVMKHLELKREKKEIGNSLEADVELGFSDDGDFQFFGKEERLLESVFLVSKVSVRKIQATSETDPSVAVSRAKHNKCARCWNFRREVGSDARHPMLCARCLETLRGKENEA